MTRSLRVARNVTTTLITQVVSWGLTLAVILYLPRYAGLAGYAKITLAGSFATLFALVSYLGTSTVLMRDIPRDPASTGRLILASLIVRTPLAIVGVGFGLAAGLLLGYGSQLLLFIAIGLIGIVVGVAFDTISSAIRGLENFSMANIGSVIDKVVNSALIIYVCISGWPLWVIVAAPIVSSALGSLVMLRGLARTDIKWVMPDMNGLKTLVVSGLPFVSAGVFVVIYGKTDPIFLKQMSGLGSVGWYGLAIRLAGTAMALPTTVCLAMLPPLSTLYRENKADFVSGAARLMNLMVLCCVPIAATMIFCPKPLIVLLSHNTASFLPAAGVVQVYGAAVMLWFISQAAFTGIVACDQQNAIGRSMGIAALASIPITAGSIYIAQHMIHNGAVGAAVSDLVVEAYLVACYAKVLPKGVMTTAMLRVLFRTTIAAIPLILALYLVPAKYALLSAVPCVAIYGVLCYQLKCLHPKDAELFRRMIGGKFGMSRT